MPVGGVGLRVEAAERQRVAQARVRRVIQVMQHHLPTVQVAGKASDPQAHAGETAQCILEAQRRRGKAPAIVLAYRL
jgi:hypothetical protein